MWTIPLYLLYVLILFLTWIVYRLPVDLFIILNTAGGIIALVIHLLICAVKYDL